MVYVSVLISRENLAEGVLTDSNSIFDDGPVSVMLI